MAGHGCASQPCRQLYSITAAVHFEPSCRMIRCLALSHARSCDGQAWGRSTGWDQVGIALAGLLLSGRLLGTAWLRS